MKILFYFIFLIGFCYCIDDSESSQNYRREYVGNDYENYGRYYGSNPRRRGCSDQGHVDRADRSRSISYPCSLHDIHCIQRVFAHNSRCTPVHGHTPDSLRLRSLPLNIPHANLTIILDNVQIKGLQEWKIKEFYINKATDRLVLEVEFDRIVVSTYTATVKFYRKGKEPVDLKDTSIIEYNDVSLTLTVPNIKNLQLSRGDVYTYLPDADPKYELGPNIYRSHDPAIDAALVELARNVNIAIREVFIIQGPIFMSVFLQSTICNFGQ